MVLTRCTRENLWLHEPRPGKKLNGGLMIKHIFFATIAWMLLLTACRSAGPDRTALVATKTTAPAKEAADPYIWLEEVLGAKPLAWVEEQNSKSLSVLENLPIYKPLQKDVARIVLAKDRLPTVSLEGDYLYNFWQDEKNVRGLWRRTSLREFSKPNPKWESVLNLDELAKTENENWVWKGAQCLEPLRNLCLVNLSRGGKDAVVVKEFDRKAKSFVTGFALPEAKHRYAWVDENTLLVATDYGPGSLSSSGYPLVIKRWTRGTPLTAATEVFRGQPGDFSVDVEVQDEEFGVFKMFSRNISFFESENFVLHENQTLKVPVPNDAKFEGIFKSYLIFSLRSDLSGKRAKFTKGSLVALLYKDIVEGRGDTDSLELVFAPTATRFVADVNFSRDALLINILDNVTGKVLMGSRENEHRAFTEIPLGTNGMANVFSADRFQTNFLVSYQDFLTPASLYLAGTPAKTAPRLLKRAPPRFDARKFTSEQFFATSADGTKVPYFIISAKNLARNGANPTLLYGYGGFEISETPFYLAHVGKTWLERGGVYVEANIRGGGEFGPAWHEAALKQNRQRAYDDFIAIAEDLIARKITSPRHLGIHGGSNGGLLVGSVFVQRPELFEAVLCEVPLLDMIRYPLLPAGASWIGEYGDPSDPSMRAAILKYSPYQNLKPGIHYPEVFFLTSTKDDRVHPGHARKMVARMNEYGHPHFYFENVEGGHGAAANLNQRVRRNALEYSYLWHKLK